MCEQYAIPHTADVVSLIIVALACIRVSCLAVSGMVLGLWKDIVSAGFRSEESDLCMLRSFLFKL